MRNSVLEALLEQATNAARENADALKDAFAKAAGKINVNDAKAVENLNAKYAQKAAQAAKKVIYEVFNGSTASRQYEATIAGKVAEAMKTGLGGANIKDVGQAIETGAEQFVNRGAARRLFDSVMRVGHTVFGTGKNTGAGVAGFAEKTFNGANRVLNIRIVRTALVLVGAVAAFLGVRSYLRKRETQNAMAVEQMQSAIVDARSAGFGITHQEVAAMGSAMTAGRNGPAVGEFTRAHGAAAVPQSATQLG